MDQTNKCAKCETLLTKKRQKYCSQTCRYKHWVENNRDRNNANVREYRRKRYEKEGCWRDEGAKAKAQKAWMIDIKSKPCHDCGGVFPVCCMDFDHREGETKSYNLGSMFAHHYSRELIETELAKCDLVCANCHRIRTRDRRTGKPLKPYEPRKRKSTICAVPEDGEIK